MAAPLTPVPHLPYNTLICSPQPTPTDTCNRTSRNTPKAKVLRLYKKHKKYKKSCARRPTAADASSASS